MNDTAAAISSNLAIGTDRKNHLRHQRGRCRDGQHQEVPTKRAERPLEAVHIHAVKIQKGDARKNDEDDE